MRKYVKNHGIIFGGPQNFVGFSTGPWTGKGWETLPYSKQLTFGCHGNIPAFMSFLPYSKLRAMVAIVTVAKDFM
jgi:hypothetical protein